MDIFEKIEEFNKIIIGINREKIELLSDRENKWLICALKEEIDEYTDAIEVVDKVDALIDLIYFACGGLTRMGLSHEQSNAVFEVIHQANMKKARGKKEGRAVQFELDAAKPDDWIAPEDKIQAILEPIDA